MNIPMKRLSDAAPVLAVVVLLSSGPWRSPAFADGPAPSKGTDVSTVGTGPYTGPTPEELSKLAQVQASPETASLPAKEPPLATITASGGNSLTDAERAKLAALLAIPVTLPTAIMPKLELMRVPKIGVPDLTPQEREKHAREPAAPNPIVSPPAAPQLLPADAPPASAPTTTAIAEPAGATVPTAPKTAPRNDR